MNKEIPGFNYYKADREGNIYSCHKGGHLKQSITKNGYKQVGLSVNGKIKTYSVHRLVMLAFKGKSDLYVNHIDGDKLNNNINNLEYCTASENTQHAYDNGLIKKRKGLESHMFGLYGKNHNKSKSILQYNKNGEFIKNWNCGIDIKRELNISSSNITQCCKGKHVRTAGGFIWRYA